MRSIYQTIISITIILTAIIAAGAQTIPSNVDTLAPGKIKEIALARKVYVWANNLAARQTIVEELAKDPLLTVVDQAENAEFALLFGLEKEPRGLSLWGRSIQLNQHFTGGMTAIRAPSGEPETVRIVWSTRKRHDNGMTLNQQRIINETREFLKALRRVRAAIDPMDPNVLPMLRVPVNPQAKKPAGTSSGNAAPASPGEKVSTGQESTPSKPAAAARKCYENGRKVPCP